MSDFNTKFIHMGEVKVGKKGDILKTTLGSCVGIALIWTKREICGLCHCLLSEDPEKTFQIGAKYVDQAIESLLVLMHVHEEDYGDIQAVVVGGANMISSMNNEAHKLIGDMNSKSAVKYLKSLKIKIVHNDTGGIHGRKFTLDCSTGKFEVEPIPRIMA